MIELGATVKDKNSPFKGLVTSRTEYLNDSPRLGVTSQDSLGDNGKPINAWLAESEVDVVS